MVFAILVGATAFSMVFTYSGGDTMVEEKIGAACGSR
jgi:TRAP-type mannitol/chloroaromatic compound transport system permease large subunit